MNAVAVPQRTPSRIPLHTAAYGGSARPLLIWGLIGGTIILPGIVIDTVRRGSARDIFNMLALALVFGWIFWFQLRERPRVYASNAGLDLEWAWGTCRRIAWSEIRSVKADSLLGKYLGRRFHVRLSKGSLHFYARSNLPELLEPFLASGPAR
ncbi:MAG TPA: hypothetical protein VGL19_16775 [Polyangiaceae bacterium]